MGQQRRCYIIAGALVGLIGLPGCLFNRTKTPMVVAAAREHPLLGGIPLPRGFRLDETRSSGFQNAHAAAGHYVYKGGKPAAEVVKHFGENMTLAGYTLRQRSVDRGNYFLTYDSAQHECRMVINRSGWSTYITIDLVPRQAAPPPRRPPPPRGPSAPPPRAPR